MLVSLFTFSVMKIKLLRNGAIIKNKEIPSRILKYCLKTKRGLFIPKLPYLYLLEKGILPDLKYKEKLLSFSDILERFKKYDSHIFSKYLIFRDLSERGYFVTEGYGKGIDLLVYDKGDFPGKSPTIRIIGVEEGGYISVKEILDELYFSILNKKRLVIAVIERRGEVIYYSIESFEGKLKVRKKIF